MSYDIGLLADLGGPVPVDLGYSWNYTYNIQPMLAEAGLPSLNGLDGVEAGEASDTLSKVLHELRNKPEHYKTFNPSNGWGSYDTIVPLLVEMIERFREAPRAKVRVS